jgi:hypothetical protein
MADTMSYLTNASISASVKPSAFSLVLPDSLLASASAFDCIF